MTEAFELARAYAAETARLMRQRLAIVAPLFVVLMGAGIAFEVFSYPERRATVLGFWVAESSLVVLAALVSRQPAFERFTATACAFMMGGVATLITAYDVVVGGHPERNAMTIITLLNGNAVLMPWGPRVQAAGAGLALIGYGVLGPMLPAPGESWVLSWIAVGVAAVTSVVGAYFLDRYRFEAFRRSSLHAEEADIAATLLKATETLSAHLGAPDMLEQLNRFAREATGCEWTSTFLFDESRGVYRLAANVGSRETVLESLWQTEYAPESLPLLEGFRPGTLVEIASAKGQDLVPESVLRRSETSSALYAPIGRGDRIVGVLINGYRTREGTFTERQRRLTLGIAHAAAVALENARLIENLQAASRLKSDFVATMSHELRTPLNVIMGYSEMLSEDVYPAGTATWKETLGRIQRASVELMELITATLDMGRLEAGRDTVMLGPVSLGQMLDEIAREVEPLVPPTVRFACANTLGTEIVTTDGAKLKTVVKNLVGNALKFTTDGTVEVDARADGDVLTIAVRDTGIGIAPEYLPVIFEMFRQVDGSTTRRYGGVGLGLHIVKRLVTLLGGSIDVASTVGRGSTFTVTLPVDRVRPDARLGAGADAGLRRSVA
jgi:signal transduction histidine kinase